MGAVGALWADVIHNLAPNPGGRLRTFNDGIGRAPRPRPQMPCSFVPDIRQISPVPEPIPRDKWVGPFRIQPILQHRPPARTIESKPVARLLITYAYPSEPLLLFAAFLDRGGGPSRTESTPSARRPCIILSQHPHGRNPRQPAAAVIIISYLHIPSSISPFSRAIDPPLSNSPPRARTSVRFERHLHPRHLLVPYPAVLPFGCCVRRKCAQRPTGAGRRSGLASPEPRL